MCDKENIPNGRQRISSESELEEGLKIFSSKEQLYSIAVFDVLGFSNLSPKPTSDDEKTTTDRA